MNNLSSKWEKFVTSSVLVSLVVLYLQIPHMVAAGDCLLALGIGIAHIHPVIDFLLWGIDLLEAIPIMGITIVAIDRIRKHRKKT